MGVAVPVCLALALDEPHERGDGRKPPHKGPGEPALGGSCPSFSPSTHPVSRAAMAVSMATLPESLHIRARKNTRVIASKHPTIRLMVRKTFPHCTSELAG